MPRQNKDIHGRTSITQHTHPHVPSVENVTLPTARRWSINAHCNLRVAVTWPLSKADVSHRCHEVSQSRQWCCAKMLVRETATSKIITKGKRHCIPSRPSSTCRQMSHEAAVLDTILTPHTPCRTMDMQPPVARDDLV